MVTKSRRASKEDGFKKTTLKNGIRVVTETLPWVRSVSIGVWFDVGSRNEKPDENGLSHFIEHMVFKGTKRRNAAQIASSLEPLGGSLNAFTSRENTCYIARILDEHLEEAVDVLADITCNATFTPTNLKREKTVICEEIKESHDTPSDKIHDNFARVFWGDHPLGQPIMGEQENVLGMSQKRMKNYVKRNYKSGSVVVAASGSISHARLVKMVREKFALDEGVAEPALEPKRSENHAFHIEQTEGFQTHLCLGVPGVSYSHEQKMAMMVLHSYLGGGMSSILFQKVREEKGLAYAVYTFHDFYRDAGVFGAYLGTDARNVRQAYDIVIREMIRTTKRQLPSAKVDQVKKQIKGQFTLGMESTSNRMTRIARQELVLGETPTIQAMLKQIDKVKPSDVLEVANRMIDKSHLAVAILGPVGESAFDDVI